jgi:aspartate aminotransferase
VSGRLPDRLLAGSRRPPSLGTPVPGSVSLAMGEPYGGTPGLVVEAAVDALHRGRTTYSPLTGEPALRTAVAEHLSGGLDARNVVLTHGASAGLAAAVLALVEPGERVVLPEPTYSLYADHVAMAGGEITWVPNTADGRLDLPRLEEQLVGARLVVICNPSNPTGRVCPGPDLAALVEAADRAGAWVLVDEAYRDLVFDGVPFSSAVSLMAAGYENVLVCGTFSKSYAMTGWRLGWVAAPAALADAVNLVHRSVNGALSMFVQDAGLVALTLPPDYLQSMLAGFQLRRDLVVEALGDLDGVHLATPEGAFYAFPRIEGCTDSRALTATLAQNGVLVRAGWEFGPSGEGHVRLSFATDVASLRTGLHRMRDCLVRVA